MLERLEPVLRAEGPDLVIVPGDVNSTLGAALCAAKLGIAVAHLESGLRSFDRTMPEETNRIGADLLASVCFLHCDEAVENLRAEGVEESRMKFVGNTMIDTLVALSDRIRERRVAATLGLEPGGYLLVTLHRPALVDGPLLAETMQRLSEVGRELPVVFPAHPRTRKMLDGASHPSVTVIDPVGYLDFLSLESAGGRRAHRLRGHPGGDDLPRDPLLHAPRQHRAPGDDPGWNQHPARLGPRPHNGDTTNACRLLVCDSGGGKVR